MFFSKSLPKGVINFAFLGLTVFKAGYIVAIFMHLGDELKGFRFAVLIPLVLFVWFIIAFLSDGSFWLSMNDGSPARTHIEHPAAGK